MRFLHSLLSRQYLHVMSEAYRFAYSSVPTSIATKVLDCGAGDGSTWETQFGAMYTSSLVQYMGLEWSREAVARASALGRNVLVADLNGRLPVDTESQDCVVALSVLEHLLMPVSFLRECHRVLAQGGRLIVLTPNISTYFTALQVLLGRMPSSGPHPDSSALANLQQGESLSGRARDDISSGTPEHRHLVVFSYSALKHALLTLGFDVVRSRGFGWYPLPIMLQPMLERIDPWHCHQMVFVCRKASGEQR